MTTRIEITNYDGTVDQMIIDERPKQNGLHTTEILTEQVYRRIDEYNFANQRVQSVMFNKYMLTYLAIEDHGAELLRYAKTIKVIAYNNTIIHDAVVLDITREQQSDTDFSLIMVEYYDRNLSNYKYGEPPVVNFLRSDVIKQQVESLNDIGILRVSYDGTLVDYATYLDIRPTAAAPESQSFTNTQSGATITS